APGRFVAGESSAVVQIAARDAARPVFTVEPAATGGVNGQPTLVSNVETLAQLAVLARLGPTRFAEVGVPAEVGTALLTVHRGADSRVVEAPIGIAMMDLFGGTPWRGVLTGGYHGNWLDSATAAATVVSRDALAAVGGSLGAGVLLALPMTACPLVESAPLVERMAAETVGQCGPCINGLPAIASVLSSLATGTAGDGDLTRLRRWCGMVDGRGACAHPDGVAGFVRSLLSSFESEVEWHLRGGCGLPYQALLPLGELAA
ncbi:MAG: NADH-ubiquinone oxidoreductase-F iron-sulfur binding region domain-containing protein, partial [Mycobacteriales bacterium]